MNDADNRVKQPKSGMWVLVACVVALGILGLLLAVGLPAYVLYWQLRETHKWSKMDDAQKSEVADRIVASILRDFDPPATQKTTSSPTLPTTEEISAYLIGKTLPLPETDVLDIAQGDKSTKSYVIKRRDVEGVLRFADRQTENKPTSIPVNVLFHVGEDRYSMDADVLYESAEGATTITGITLRKVAKE